MKPFTLAAKTSVAVATALSLAAGAVAAPQAMAVSGEIGDISPNPRVTYPETNLKGDKGTTVSATPQNPVPAGTTFEVGHTGPGNLADYFDYTVDKNTGTITLTTKQALRSGTRVAVIVRANYADGSSQNIGASFHVTSTGALDATKVSFSYDPVTGPADTTLIATPKIKGTLPAGAKFQPVEAPNGWTISINENTGVVSAKAPANALPGTEIAFAVPLRFKDGSVTSAPVRFRTGKPTKTQADKYSVKYSDVTTSPGKAITASPVLNPSTLPAGTKFYGPNGENQGWKYTTDQDTGKVTITPGSAATLPLEVKVQYPDGSVDTAKFRVISKSKDSSPAPSNPAPTPAPGGNGKGSSTGQIVGIILGILALIGLIGGGFWALQSMPRHAPVAPKGPMVVCLSP